MSRALGAVRRLVLFGALAAPAALAGCGPEGPRPIRLWTQNYEFRITADPSPPRAREVTRYRIVVVDRDTRQSLDRGAGQIFAKSQDGATVYDGFEPAAEAGTYTARLNFITAGQWRMNVRFQRDSNAQVTASIEQPVDDWVQVVRGARDIRERPSQ